MNKKRKTVGSAPHKTALIALFVRLGKGSAKAGRKQFNESLDVSYQRSTNWINRGLPVEYVISIHERWGVPIDALARDDVDLAIAKEYFNAQQPAPANQL